MTIGKQFLQKLNEAKKPIEKPETSAKYDRGTEALKKSLRTVGGVDNNLADAMAEVLNALGVGGRFLNTKDVRDAITNSALNLRSKPARVTTFLAMHSALDKAVASLQEAGEEDLEGTVFQKLIEEIIAELGFDFAGNETILRAVKRRAAQLQADAAVKQALLAFARRAKIRVGDKVVGGKKAVMEADEVDPNTPIAAGLQSFIDSARDLALALGIPSKTLDLPVVKTAMRKAATKDQANGFVRRQMPKLIAALNAK